MPTPSQSELVHELKVHQMELEMQNEELRHAQIDLAAARDRYIDLYDFAPVGYFTLDKHGIVTEANLTGAKMLGAGRKDLLGRGFARFVAPLLADIWHRHMRQAMHDDRPGPIELEFRRPSGGTFHGQLDCMSMQPPGGVPALWVAMTDITVRKIAETDRRIADTVHDAREAERRLVARQLHEGLGQLLSALKMELGSLVRPLDPATQGDRVRAMLGTLDQALASVRRITTDLRPPMLDDLGLCAAIEWLAHDANRHHGMDVVLDLHEPPSMPDERTSTAIYRMAQEIVDDLARCHEIASISLSLRQQGADLVFAVRYRCKPEHVGMDCLANKDLMRSLMDRTHLLGGQLEFGDRAGLRPQITVHLSHSRREIR